MPPSPQNVVILGATGSIGRQTLEVIDHLAGRFRVVGMTTHRNMDRLVALARRYKPRWLRGTDWEHLQDHFNRTFAEDVSAETEVISYGDHGLDVEIAASSVDIIVAAMVGSAGVRCTWAAAAAGKRIALANKESLVMAGPCLMPLAARSGATIIPIDSEHSAVFQAIQAGRRSEVRRIVLTASGGPFRRLSLAELENVTVEQALAHPNWDMGPKITIDSATMMNKALEIIEARWLFDLRPDQIAVMIHPQSVVHSLVEFVDGSVMAQMSPPDMRLPIQYALTWPERLECVADKLDWRQAFSLDFEPPDLDRWDALALGLEAATAGGTAGAVLSAANEAAVEAFLRRELPFSQIVPTCRRVLEHHTFDPSPTLDQLFTADQWARQQVPCPRSPVSCPPTPLP